jgi:hypothetical protein
MKFVKNTLLFTLLPAVAFCSFVPTDEANLAYFNIFKQAYNEGNLNNFTLDNYAVIYHMFSNDT